MKSKKKMAFCCYVLRPSTQFEILALELHGAQHPKVQSDSFLLQTYTLFNLVGSARENNIHAETVNETKDCVFYV